MTKKTLFKRIASVAMAGALTLSMALPVGAATTDPNLVVEANTLYSTPITSGSSVTLGLMPANAYYQRSGFDSAADAKSSFTTTVTIGADKIDESKIAYGSMETTDYNGNKTYAGTVTVEGKDGVYGPASLHIVNKKNTSAYIDMTVYVEAAETQSAVDVAEVSVVDVRNDDAVKADGTELSVAAAKTDTTNPFYRASGSAQSYPTVGDALYSLAKANGLTFTQSDGYVNSITTKAGEKLEAYSDSNWNYYGWNYCVIRDGEKLVDGDTLSASVLEVEKDDEIIWAFGTATQAENYFNRILAE
ncbi:MAG: hypothetical protein V8T85_04315 [Blautia faecicola]